jgi:hypothetical protein
MRNASAAYVVAEREELKKVPLDIYKWDTRLVADAGMHDQLDTIHSIPDLCKDTTT